MDSVPTKKLTKKPINTALGAYGKTIGTSNAGLESGTSFLAIPWNAGERFLPIPFEPPWRTITNPAVNVPAWISCKDYSVVSIA